MRPVEELEKMAPQVHRSGLIGTNSAAQAFTILLACEQENMSLLQFRSRFHLLDDKLTTKAERMLENFASHGGKWEILQCDSEAVRIKFVSPHAGEYVSEVAWNVIEAAQFVKNRDGSIKQVWQDHRPSMLWARAVSQGIKRVDPAAADGNYTPEEVVDLEPEQSDPQNLDDDPVGQMVAEVETTAATEEKDGEARTPETQRALVECWWRFDELEKELVLAGHDGNLVRDSIKRLAQQFDDGTLSHDDAAAKVEAAIRQQFSTPVDFDPEKIEAQPDEDHQPEAVPEEVGRGTLTGKAWNKLSDAELNTLVRLTSDNPDKLGPNWTAEHTAAATAEQEKRNA